MARVKQEHHISYDPEWKVWLYKGEHMLITKMGWGAKNTVSMGFLEALEQFILRNRRRATDLDKATQEESKINRLCTLDMFDCDSAQDEQARLEEDLVEGEDE